MQLKVRDLIDLFRVSERTIESWVRRQALPAQRVAGQLRFNRFEVLDWAIAHQIKLEGVPGENQDGPLVSVNLAGSLQAGGIYYDITGDGQEAILHALVSRLPLPGDFDRGLLLHLFTARAGLGSTILGDGIAFPKVDCPIVLDVARTLTTLTFLKRPIACPIHDGQVVRILFTVISPSVTAHVQLLARLSRALSDPGFRKSIVARKPRERLLEEARRVDRTELAAYATRPRAA